MVTKEDVVDAIKTAMKPDAPKTDRERFMVWLLAKYAGLSAEDFEKFTESAKATLYGEYEAATEGERRRAQEAKQVKLPPMPGAVATDTPARQLAWANLVSLKMAGLATDDDLRRQGFPVEDKHEGGFGFK